MDIDSTDGEEMKIRMKLINLLGNKALVNSDNGENTKYKLGKDK